MVVLRLDRRHVAHRRRVLHRPLDRTLVLVDTAVAVLVLLETAALFLARKTEAGVVSHLEGRSILEELLHGNVVRF